MAPVKPIPRRFLWCRSSDKGREKLLLRLQKYRAQIEDIWILYDKQIWTMIIPSSNYHGKQQSYDHIGPNGRVDVIQDTDTQPFLLRTITRNMALCFSQLVAALREWQHAAYILACIDTATSYISKTSAEAVDPIRDAIVETIFSLPRPSLSARPLPDDRQHVMKRRVLFDEPRITTLIHSLDEGSRICMKVAADRERSHLPLFPAHFRHWDLGSGFVSAKDTQ